MQETGVMVSSTTIIAVVISIVGSILTGLISIVGAISVWSINRWVKKNDLKEVEQKAGKSRISKGLKRG